MTVAYNSGAQYATELIPTCVRGQGVAAVHVAGYALTFFSSYILYLVRSSMSLSQLSCSKIVDSVSVKYIQTIAGISTRRFVINR